MAQVLHLPCTRCELHARAYTVGMNPIVGASPKLAIFLDTPSKEEDMRHRLGFSRGLELVRWLLARNGISEGEVLISHVLRCHKPDKTGTKKFEKQAFIEACSTHRFALLQTYRPKALVAMGPIACEAFLHTEPKDRDGEKWKPVEPEVAAIVDKVWATYNPGYGIQDPTECVGLSRVLWRAAEDAGLKPYFNKDIKPFDFQT